MTKLLRLVIAVCFAITLHQTAESQSLSINTTGNPANASSILDVESTLKGMLIPRMNKTQKNAIATPANALLVYQTGPDSVGFHYYDLPNTQWIYINPSAYATDTTAWKVTGNSNITAAHFLGTLNDSALRFRIRNIAAGIVDSAKQNTALGYRSLSNITTGIGNTGMGYLAGRSITTGGVNTAIGMEALQYDTSGGANTAVGWRALRNNLIGGENTAIGVGALELDSSGSGNTAMGRSALFTLKKGLYNIGIGYQSSALTDSANNTTAIGVNALYYNEHNDNFAIGANAGTYVDLQPVPNPTTEVTYVGTDAGYGFWVGKKSVGVGYRALYNANNGTVYGSNLGRNTAIGDSAMAWTYSSRNVAIGTEALSRALVSSQNVAIGDSSMGGALTTTGNVAVGYKTLSKQQGQGFNTAVGYFSQRDSSINTYYNTSIGAYSMEFNRTGIYNTGLGLSALRSSDSASYNTAIGADAMYNHRKNGSNVAVGAFALRGDSSGFWNTAVGSEAMDGSKTGSMNAAFGFRALRYNSEGQENTAIGVGAMEVGDSADWNVAVGRGAMLNYGRANQNTAVGTYAMSQKASGFYVGSPGTELEFAL